MMKAIYLAGGGDKEQSLKLDNACREDLNDRGDRILYVPIALKRSDKYDMCDEWFKQIFSPYWYDIDVLRDPSGEVTFDDYDLVYIGGGNTYSLIDDLRKHGLVQPLKEYVNTGGMVYGGSAGAIILGDHIGTAVGDENHVNVTDFEGLGLANGYDFRPHYTDEHQDAVTDHIKRSGNR